MIDKKELLDAEILKIDNLLTDIKFSYEDNNYIYNGVKDDNSHIITLEYIDAYDYEKITLEPIIINDYGVVKYTITVESYNMDNELELSDYFYCREIKISESKLNQIENKTQKQSKKYVEATKPLILTAWSDKMITIENTIFNRDCFLNITHFHYYYGKTVTLETRDFNDISAFLQLRDFFSSVKMEG